MHRRRSIRSILPKSNGNQASRSGMSLIELVVVMLILGILAAAGTSRYADSLAFHRVQRTAQRIAADIDTARHLARSQSQQVTMQFSATGYTVTGVANPNRPQQPWVVTLDD